MEPISQYHEACKYFGWPKPNRTTLLSPNFSTHTHTPSFSALPAAAPPRPFSPKSTAPSPELVEIHPSPARRWESAACSRCLSRTTAMKEEGDGSSERRRPQGNGIFADGSIRAEWESLQPELVQLIAERILSSSCVDEYMAMRAACPSWRSAVAKPPSHAAVADLRFRPRQWVMLHVADDDEGRPLFLNVTTGCFRRLRCPVLRDYILVGASDGLLVLGDRERPHAVRLLNPLTGDMLPFAASIPPVPTQTAVTESEPTIIFSFQPYDGQYEDIPAYCCWERGGYAVYSADPTAQLRMVKFQDAALNEEGLFFLRSMVTYAGNVYVISSGGTLSKIVWTGGHCYAEQIMEIEEDYTAALVESAGKLLLVREQLETIEVFSIDVKRKVLEPIKSLGSCAIFVSPGNCMVVDADMLPSIECNCIYSTFFTAYRLDKTYALCDLCDGKKNFITVPEEPGELPGIIHEGPLSLAQALLTPYPEVEAQLDRIHQT